MGSPVSLEVGLLVASVGTTIGLFLVIAIAREMRQVRARRKRFDRLMAEIPPEKKAALDLLLVEIHNVRKRASNVEDAQWRAALELLEALDSCLDDVLGELTESTRALSNMTRTTKAIRTEWVESPSYLLGAAERLRASTSSSEQANQADQEE